MIETAKTYALVVLGFLLVSTGLATYHYRGEAKLAKKALDVQSAAIEKTNKEAKTKYDELKKDRDALQEWKNKRAQAQENQGEQAKAQIGDDSKRDTAPVIVRYVTRPARCSSDGAPGGGTKAADPGPGDTNVSSGVLAPEVERLLKRDRDDVERLQAAFNLCAERVTGAN